MRNILKYKNGLYNIIEIIYIIRSMAMEITLPYGRTHLTADIPNDRIASVLSNRINTFTPAFDEKTLVKNALLNPISSPTLEKMSVGKEKVVIIASDHTRPVPSKIIIPPMLKEIRAGNPDADITILIATGCHRNSTEKELLHKFGKDIFEHEKIVVHDCNDNNSLTDIGELPSGGRLIINKLAAEADLLVSEGFIEPHFFAGFSGGRKSVLPGVASKETVYWNHNAGFIKDEHSRAGIIIDNPIHRDMEYAAQKAGLAFICNVVINAKHEVIGAFAGDPKKAHLKGTEFVKSLCKVDPVLSKIVITSNNGYPLDQNIYQAVKGMSTAESFCKEGGIIIMTAACEDGHGGDSFYKTFASGKTPGEILNDIESHSPSETFADQWQIQILARIMSKYKVILISKADPSLVGSMQMIPASNLNEAIEIADTMVGTEEKITVIPEGVSTFI